MRTYLGYVPTSDTVQIPIFQFYTPTSPHNNTQTIPNRRDTPQVCPPKSDRRFPSDIFPLPFGHKKSLERFLLRGSKGAVTYSPYSPDFSVPSARRGLTSLFGMGRGGTLVLWPPYSLFLFPSGNSLPALCDKNHRLEANALHSASTGVISLRSLTTAVLFSRVSRRRPFAESRRKLSGN